MRMWPVLFALAACNSGAGDDYAVIPGGGNTLTGGSNGGSRDAAVGDGGDGSMPTGRVCLMTDLRTPTLNCSTTMAGGLTVTLGSQTAMTAADGSFSLVPPIGNLLVWHVRGTLLVTSAIPYSGQTVLPAITDAAYNDLLQSNSVTMVQPGQGSLVMQVVRNSVALAGAKMALTSQNNILYDANDATQWNQNTTTGTRGVIWAPGVAAGTLSYTITPAVGNKLTGTVAIEDQTITFVTQEVP